MSRYSQAHQNPKGAGDGRPTALQIIQDEGLTGKLGGKACMVTGVSSGIGIETMRALYATGAHVFGMVRNLEKGQQVVERVKADTRGGEITLIELDLASLSSVKKAVEAFVHRNKTLNVLVNNAGVVRAPQGRTEDCFETHFGSNHLGHFYLFQLLKPVLLASSTSEFPSRVVVVSSMGHRCGPVRFDDYNFNKDPYDPWLAYGQSKTANIYIANEIERRYGPQGLHATSVNPGLVMSAMSETVSPEDAEKWSDPAMFAILKSPEQGAATSVYAAISEEWKHKGGKYLSDCVEQGPTRHPDNSMHFGDEGYAMWAFDLDAQKRLWRESLRMVGLDGDGDGDEPWTFL
ncbi:hypothetical protein EV127DRAFT_496361 [Xylaria flabelliformis]|nr:hypothetical protein EV127DRAFT_496361 [Xylaria flabelliformis]